MTAVDVAISSDGQRAFILTDSGVFNEESGVLEHHITKTYTLPHCGMVMTALGVVAYSAAVNFCISRCSGIDDLQANGQAAIKKLYDECEAQHGPKYSRFVMVGWSHSRQRMAAFVADRDESFCMRGPLRTVLEPGNVGFSFDGEDDDIPAYLLDRMMRQRKTTLGVTAGMTRQYVGIGGAAILTELRNDLSITQRPIYAWTTDVCGAPIPLEAA